MIARLAPPALLAAALLAAAPGGAAAQSISAGQTVNGRLDTSDPKMSDNSHYDEYTYRGRAGERITITLRSREFDTFLAWGTRSGTTFASEGTDDDGAGGTDSQLTVTVGSAGTYVIRANSVAANTTGAYTLSVQPAGGTPAPAPQPGPAPSPQPGPQGGGGSIASGQTVNGRLDTSDSKLGDNSYFDDYTYRGRPGERITITLRSREFDTFLGWGTRSGTGFASEGTDDDGAGGTDSQLTVTVGSAGTYVIRANSVAANTTGAYTLSVQPAGGTPAPAPAPRPGPAPTPQPGPQGGGGSIASGQTVSGRLDASDPKMSDNSYFDDYTYRGRPGERITITMRSGAFDTFLAWGTRSGTSFTSEGTDDDGAGGTDSQLTVAVGSAGTYVIRANSVAPNVTGPYTLTVQPATGAPTPQPRPSPGPGPQASGGGGSIAPGQTVSGRLDASDPKMGDNSYYDDYTYSGRPGDQLVITLRSGDFDTYLAWGRGTGTGFTSESSDDDGAGGTDSQVRVTVGSSGTYVVRANSLGAGKTGSYTLAVERAGGAPRTDSRTGGNTIRSGESVNGRLETSDARMSDQSFVDTYVYQGRPGEQILVTLTSSDFDAYLRGGRMQGSEFVAVDSDDDGAGGTNSRLQVTVDASGTYAIQANSLRPNTTGGYTLRVEGAGGTPTGAASIAMGQTVNGRIDTTDPKLSDNTHYDLYVYRGRPGEQVLVTLRSTAFDAYLAWGRMAGNTFTSEASDDDSGGGSNSQLVATVGSSGTYAIQANTLRAGETGSYTLSVEPVSAARQTTASAPAGAVTLSAGQTVSGTLTRSDLMLSDSSFFDQYVYRGRPGERLQITMRSTDFDAYLRWGLLSGNNFQAEATDDDAGGGTDAQVTVTVGGTGVYVVQANAFEAGKTGSYTLTVQSLSATASAPTETRPAAGGKWVYSYVSASNPVFRPLEQRFKQSGMLESLVEGLNQQFPLPRNVGLRSDQCGQVNAFYNPRDGTVTFCYELFQDLVNQFVPDGAWTTEQRETVDGAATFILMHEVGHALVDVLDLPITGREEDAVDQLAAVMLIGSGDKGAVAALNGVRAIQPGPGATYDDSDFADEHSLGPQRLFNIACWIYGSDPQKYASLVTQGGLPAARARRCPGEYERLSKAWMRLLQTSTPAAP
jgi:hypothetical protein